MNSKIKILLVLLVCFAVTSQAFAGPRTKFGTMAAPELLIPIGSVGTSLNGSNLASVSGIDAMYWNPAGLSSFTGQTGEALFSHMNYIADINMQYVAGVVRVGNLGNLGASIRSLNFGEELVTDENNPEGTGATFKPTYIIATLSYAKAMTDKINFGTNVKIISEQIADVSATGMAFDFGLQYIAGSSGLRFGIALKNLGSSMKFDGPGLDRSYTSNGQTVVRRTNLQEFDLPTNLEMGVSYTAMLNRQNELTLMTAFQNSGFSSDEFRFGLEYNYNRNFYLRGAMNITPDYEEDEKLFGPTFGAGIKYPFGTMILGFDYAYRIVTEEAFNSTNQYFTLNVGF